MKTAKGLLKLIAFMLMLVWLASCGSSRRNRIAEEIHHVKFALDLLGGQLSHIDKRMNSYRFVDDLAFSANKLSEGQLAIKRQQAKDAQREYLELSTQRTRISIKMIMLKVKYDSLNTELKKY